MFPTLNSRGWAAILLLILYNPAIWLCWSFLPFKPLVSWSPASLFSSFLPSLHKWSSSGSCLLWILPDVSTSGYALCPIYNKPSPALNLVGLTLALLLSKTLTTCVMCSMNTPIPPLDHAP